MEQNKWVCPDCGANEKFDHRGCNIFNYGKWISVICKKPSNDRLVDVYVKSKNNSDFGKRVINCSFKNNKWHGVDEGFCGVFVSHWMEIPTKPE